MHLLEVQKPISEGLLVYQGWYMRPPQIPYVKNQMAQTEVLQLLAGFLLLTEPTYLIRWDAHSTQSVGIPVGISPAVG